MTSGVKIVRLAGLRSPEQFKEQLGKLGIELPCDETLLRAGDSPLASAVPGFEWNGKALQNRFVIHPMEGWDGTTTGGPTESVLRRWRRFGESGAKLIFGGEAMAVRPDGRANPNQLIINEANQAGLARLRETLLAAHRERFGTGADPVIGFQLTHSGRFCKPNDHFRMEPRVAYRHPILDGRFGISSDRHVFTDTELDDLVLDYVRAARVARDAGADFVDIKHCHGYLLHELLSARGRPGKFGGSFENRTRMLRDIIAAIRADGNLIAIGVRLSAFDLVPFRAAPANSQPGRPGTGIPEDYTSLLPYTFGFGVNPDNPLEPDLTEAHRFVELCAGLGVKIVNITAGSPYYNPHIQRPAAYPPSDGYLPPEDPLVGVARQIHCVRQLRERAPRSVLLVGTGYSYLQEFLPHVAQAVVRQGWTDLVGIGRMVLSYPEIFADSLRDGMLNSRLICRTFSDCTTAPRKGLPSGCYPLDQHYGASDEGRRLKVMKRGRNEG